MTRRFEDQKQIVFREIAKLLHGTDANIQVERLQAMVDDGMQLALTEGWRMGVYAMRESLGDHKLYPQAGEIPAAYADKEK